MLVLHLISRPLLQVQLGSFFVVEKIVYRCRSLSDRPKLPIYILRGIFYSNELS